MLIDTHCHLNLPPLIEDIDEVISRAIDSGVQKIICPGIDMQTSVKALDLSERYDIVYPACGIHPHDSGRLKSGWEKELEQLAGDDRFVAIGETGLDFYRNYSTVKDQKKAFMFQLELAREFGKPVIVHNRKADAEIEKIVKEVGYFKLVFHCYSSDLYFTKKFLEYDVFFSFTGSITYGRKKTMEVLDLLPIDRIMVETDAPYIIPAGVKVEYNEPKNVVYVAKRLAEYKGIPYEEVCHFTTQNAIEFFHLK
ncbi:MAG: TatD family hydrolase [Candidatus Marinimicrobia bacterium]|nr:TatD family hydrolase [Candidatus Neomarinimicrobiota bacterium]